MAVVISDRGFAGQGVSGVWLCEVVAVAVCSGVLSYERPDEGEWVQPVFENYKMACCDCGLVHRMNFRVKGGRPQFQVFRDNRATGQVRRRRDEKK